ncbi:GNAT family N-acetyltransferase [Ilyomonas limi]|uniref:GNAT family N-acetyltransferase n=1 Tax=Ilyomonas limi TaxID=2575867 RepID=A0A4U3L0I5_9BACT|nr:GNAT family N-acetyltransferase [Ilyomonas limi]TKK66947.1 GNAT family N-acetyltransferase [Ilyomonas limi]
MQQRFLPSLTTERLLLRQLQLTDDKAIFLLRNNEQVNAFIQRPLLNNINDAHDFISTINEGIENKEWLYWAMVLKNTQQLIGTICLWHFSNDNTTAEIGYELHPHFQGAGLMNEALQKIIDYGFTTLHLKTIEAYTQPDNKRSIQLLEKNYFVQDQNKGSTIIRREIRLIRTKPQH